MYNNLVFLAKEYLRGSKIILGYFYCIIFRIYKEFYLKLLPILLLFLVAKGFGINVILITVLLIVFTSFILERIYTFFSIILEQRILKLRLNYSRIIAINKLKLPITDIESKEFQDKNWFAGKFLETDRTGYTNIAKKFSDFPMQIIVLIIYFITLQQLSIVLVLAIVIVNIVILYFGKYFNKKIYKLEEKKTEYYREQSHCDQTIKQPETMLEIQYYSQLSKFTWRYRELSKQIIANSKKIMFWNNLKNVTESLITNSTMFFAFATIFLFTVSAGNNYEAFYVYFILVSGLFASINSFKNSIDSYMYEKPYMENAIVLLKQERIDERPDFTETIETIEFKNVSFIYPRTTQKIISDLNLKLECNKIYALIGENGCGKSTLINLLLGYYKIDQGHILINGKDIQTFSQQSIIMKFSVVFQTLNIFPFTYQENINVTTNDFDMERYSEIEDLFPVTKRFKGNLTANMTKRNFDDGVELSGGQKQQLCILRGIYSNNELWILDEPTSELDPDSENMYYKKILRETKDKLVLFTSHRMSACKYADQIIYMESGTIVELGTHEELLEKKGKYYIFSELQEQVGSKNEN